MKGPSCTNMNKGIPESARLTVRYTMGFPKGTQHRESWGSKTLDHGQIIRHTFIVSPPEQRLSTLGSKAFILIGCSKFLGQNVSSKIGNPQFKIGYTAIFQKFSQEPIDPIFPSFVSVVLTYFLLMLTLRSVLSTIIFSVEMKRSTSVEG